MKRASLEIIKIKRLTYISMANLPDKTLVTGAESLIKVESGPRGQVLPNILDLLLDFDE